MGGEDVASIVGRHRRQVRRALLQLVGLATWTFAALSVAVVVGGFVMHVVNS
jgi:hypothetical protein